MSRFDAGARPLSRDIIVRTAIELADTEGVGAVTIRRVAAVLDVTPMALYRYVGDRDGLVLAVADLLLDRAGTPAEGLDWTGYLAEIARGLRRLFAEHPTLVEIFTRQPVTTPAARRRLERTVEVGIGCGLSEGEAIRAYAAVHTYSIGFCALEAGRRRFSRPEPIPDDRTAEAIHSFVTDEQFQVGLDAMLSGLVHARNGT